MAHYIRRRLITAVPVFFGITLVVFFFMNLAPGSVTELMGEGASSAEEQAALEARPWTGQALLGPLCTVAGGAFPRGFGRVLPSGAECIPPDRAAHWAITASHRDRSGGGGGGGHSVGDSVGLEAAFPLGPPFQSLHRGRVRHPGLFLALVSIYLFAVKLRWLPASGMYASGSSGPLTDLLRHLLLPAGVVGLSNVGGILKQTRSACLEVLGEDYVTTARAKGLKEAAVVLRHGFRTALIPVLTTVLTHIPHIIGGSVVVERVFGWPGMGSLMFSAISGRDYNVIMGVTVVIALAVLCTNLLLDLVYGMVDPRVRYEGI